MTHGDFCKYDGLYFRKALLGIKENKPSNAQITSITKPTLQTWVQVYAGWPTRSIQDNIHVSFTPESSFFFFFKLAFCSWGCLSYKAAVVDCRKNIRPQDWIYAILHYKHFLLMQFIPLDLQEFLRIDKAVPKCGHVLSTVAAFHQTAT